MPTKALTRLIGRRVTVLEACNRLMEDVLMTVQLEPLLSPDETELRNALRTSSSLRHCVVTISTSALRYNKYVR